ncbi:hypothetical protein TcCL_NonESM07663 [Trypanosoma cruzi]|nr:hypothetical protein TcCL_NonESM07663 [Trypanosoma cruzi]
MLSSDLPPGTLRAATRRASSNRGVPMTPRTTSDDRSLKRSAPLWDRMTQAAGRTACLSLSMRLDPLRCHLTPGQSSCLWGSSARLLTALRGPAERSVFSPSTAAEIYPFPRLAASKSPTRVPVAADSLSAIEALRLGPLAVHGDVAEEIGAMPPSLADRGRTAGSVFSHDAAESHAACQRTLTPSWHNPSRRAASLPGTWTFSPQ